jgi:hypothetical protein
MAGVSLITVFGRVVVVVFVGSTVAVVQPSTLPSRSWTETLLRPSGSVIDVSGTFTSPSAFTLNHSWPQGKRGESPS